MNTYKDFLHESPLTNVEALLPDQAMDPTKWIAMKTVSEYSAVLDIAGIMLTEKSFVWKNDDKEPTVYMVANGSDLARVNFETACPIAEAPEWVKQAVPDQPANDHVLYQDATGVSLDPKHSWASLSKHHIVFSNDDSLENICVVNTFTIQVLRTPLLTSLIKVSSPAEQIFFEPETLHDRVCLLISEIFSVENEERSTGRMLAIPSLLASIAPTIGMGPNRTRLNIAARLQGQALSLFGIRIANDKACFVDAQRQILDKAASLLKQPIG